MRDACSWPDRRLNQINQCRLVAAGPQWVPGIDFLVPEQTQMQFTFRRQPQRLHEWRKRWLMRRYGENFFIAEYLAVPEKLDSTMGHAVEAVLVAPIGNGNRI